MTVWIREEEEDEAMRSIGEQHSSYTSRKQQVSMDIDGKYIFEMAGTSPPPTPFKMRRDNVNAIRSARVRRSESLFDKNASSTQPNEGARRHMQKSPSGQRRERRSSLPDEHAASYMGSRFAHNFEVLCKLGSGSFGTVYKCRKFMDRSVYAIKKSKRPIRRTSDRKQTMQEVYALAAMRSTAHVIRYYESWWEGEHLFLQTEACDGNLRDLCKELADSRPTRAALSESTAANNPLAKGHSGREAGLTARAWERAGPISLGLPGSGVATTNAPNQAPRQRARSRAGSRNRRGSDPSPMMFVDADEDHSVYPWLTARTSESAANEDVTVPYAEAGSCTVRRSKAVMSRADSTGSYLSEGFTWAGIPAPPRLPRSHGWGAAGDSAGSSSESPVASGPHHIAAGASTRGMDMVIPTLGSNHSCVPTHRPPPELRIRASKPRTQQKEGEGEGEGEERTPASVGGHWTSADPMGPPRVIISSRMHRVPSLGGASMEDEGLETPREAVRETGLGQGPLGGGRSAVVATPNDASSRGFRDRYRYPPPRPGEINNMESMTRESFGDVQVTESRDSGQMSDRTSRNSQPAEVLPFIASCEDTAAGSATMYGCASASTSVPMRQAMQVPMMAGGQDLVDQELDHKGECVSSCSRPGSLSRYQEQWYHHEPTSAGKPLPDLNGIVGGHTPPAETWPPPPEAFLVEIVRQCLLGLKDLHYYSTPLVHLDIKPGNLLFCRHKRASEVGVGRAAAEKVHQRINRTKNMKGFQVEASAQAPDLLVSAMEGRAAADTLNSVSNATTTSDSRRVTGTVPMQMERRDSNDSDSDDLPMRSPVSHAPIYDFYGPRRHFQGKTGGKSYIRWKDPVGTQRDPSSCALQAHAVGSQAPTYIASCVQPTETQADDMLYSVVEPPRTEAERRAVNSLNYGSLFTVKICDLGLATRADSKYGVEDGDPRYLAPELLDEDFSDLPKADIFSLGASIYELALGQPLPRSGPGWKQLRCGRPPELSGYSQRFYGMLKSMLQPDPTARNNAKMMLAHEALTSRLEFLLMREQKRSDALQRHLIRAVRRAQLHQSYTGNYRGAAGAHMQPHLRHSLPIGRSSAIGLQRMDSAPEQRERMDDVSLGRHTSDLGITSYQRLGEHDVPYESLGEGEGLDSADFFIVPGSQDQGSMPAPPSSGSSIGMGFRPMFSNQFHKSTVTPAGALDSKSASRSRARSGPSGSLQLPTDIAADAWAVQASPMGLDSNVYAQTNASAAHAAYGLGARTESILAPRPASTAAIEEVLHGYSTLSGQDDEQMGPARTGWYEDSDSDGDQPSAPDASRVSTPQSRYGGVRQATDRVNRSAPSFGPRAGQPTDRLSMRHSQPSVIPEASTAERYHSGSRSDSSSSASDLDRSFVSISHLKQQLSSDTDRRDDKHTLQSPDPPSQCRAPYSAATGDPRSAPGTARRYVPSQVTRIYPADRFASPHVSVSTNGQVPRELDFEGSAVSADASKSQPLKPSAERPDQDYGRDSLGIRRRSSAVGVVRATQVSLLESHRSNSRSSAHVPSKRSFAEAGFADNVDPRQDSMMIRSCSSENFVSMQAASRLGSVARAGPGGVMGGRPVQLSHSASVVRDTVSEGAGARPPSSPRTGGCGRPTAFVARGSWGGGSVASSQAGGSASETDRVSLLDLVVPSEVALTPHGRLSPADLQRNSSSSSYHSGAEMRTDMPIDITDAIVPMQVPHTHRHSGTPPTKVRRTTSVSTPGSSRRAQAQSKTSSTRGSNEGSSSNSRAPVSPRPGGHSGLGYIAVREARADAAQLGAMLEGAERAVRGGNSRHGPIRASRWDEKSSDVQDASLSRIFHSKPSEQTPDSIRNAGRALVQLQLDSVTSETREIDHDDDTDAARRGHPLPRHKSGSDLRDIDRNAPPGTASAPGRSHVKGRHSSNDCLYGPSRVARAYAAPPLAWSYSEGAIPSPGGVLGSADGAWSTPWSHAGGSGTRSADSSAAWSSDDPRPLARTREGVPRPGDQREDQDHDAHSRQEGGYDGLHLSARSGASPLVKQTGLLHVSPAIHRLRQIGPYIGPWDSASVSEGPGNKAAFDKAGEESTRGHDGVKRALQFHSGLEIDGDGGGSTSRTQGSARSLDMQD